MAKANAKSKSGPRRLPRGRHALTPEAVLSDQRERLIAAVPAVVAEHGFEAMSVSHIVKAAAVSRNAFYANFGDKRECFAAAHEAGHERLFEVLAGPCEEEASVGERVENSLDAGLTALASEPAMARLLFVEAPSAGEEIALRYHEWLQRYGSLLRAVAADAPERMSPAPEVTGVIVGGIASRIASEMLQGRGTQLRYLTEPFVEYVLAFYRPSEPGPQEGKVVPFEQEREPATELFEARKQAGA
jgi:AcrR family transcriptional regulator